MGSGKSCTTPVIRPKRAEKSVENSAGGCKEDCETQGVMKKELGGKEKGRQREAG